MHMNEGMGAGHAEFSPVATASYCLMRAINIVRPILGANAVKFAGYFPEGLLGLGLSRRARGWRKRM